MMHALGWTSKTCTDICRGSLRTRITSSQKGQSHAARRSTEQGLAERVRHRHPNGRLQAAPDHQRPQPDRLANEVEFYYLRPRDIAVYVGEGTLDVGISGRDLVLDSHADADILMELGFGSSTFRFAGRPGVAASVKDLSGKRIATSYAGS